MWATEPLNQHAHFTHPRCTTYRIIHDSPIYKLGALLSLCVLAFSECLDSASLQCTCTLSELTQQKIDVLVGSVFLYVGGFLYL